MQVGNVFQTASQQTGPRIVNEPNDVLGKEDFLRLLLEQLKNQDPLQPLKDQDFIAQLAQFRSLEQAQEMNENLQALIDFQHVGLASALIGKHVDPRASGIDISGTVSDVEISNRQVKLKVGSQDIDLADIVRVSDSNQTGNAGSSEQAELAADTDGTRS